MKFALAGDKIEQRTVCGWRYEFVEAAWFTIFFDKQVQGNGAGAVQANRALRETIEAADIEVRKDFPVAEKTRIVDWKRESQHVKTAANLNDACLRSFLLILNFSS